MRKFSCLVSGLAFALGCGGGGSPKVAGAVDSAESAAPSFVATTTVNGTAFGSATKAKTVETLAVAVVFAGDAAALDDCKVAICAMESWKPGRKYPVIMNTAGAAIVKKDDAYRAEFKIKTPDVAGSYDLVFTLTGKKGKHQVKSSGKVNVEKP